MPQICEPELIGLLITRMRGLSIGSKSFGIDFSVVVTWNIEWRVGHGAVVIRALRFRTST